MAKRSNQNSHVYSALKKYGAPFWNSPESDLTLEQAIILGLKYCTPKDHASIPGIIPYVLAINSKNLDTDKLLKLAKSKKQKQLLGYFSEFACKFKSSTKLKDFGRNLFQDNYRTISLSGIKPTKFMKAAIEHKNNKLAKKWQIITLDEVEGHLIRYRKWSRVK